MAFTVHKVTPSITVDTAAYAAGDVLLAATSLGNVVATTGAKLKLTGITGCEDGGQAPAFTIMFFNASPGQSAAANAAVVWGASDDDYFAGMIRVVGGDWYTVGSHSFMSLGGAEVDIDMGSSSELWMIILADSAYDAVAANDLRVTLHFEGE